MLFRSPVTITFRTSKEELAEIKKNFQKAKKLKLVRTMSDFLRMATLTPLQ